MPKRSPSILGQYYAVIEDDNILAHSIRKIENAIFEKLKRMGRGVHYRINIYCENTVSKSSAIFAKNSCCIYLPKKEATDEKERINNIHELRIRLAHELGHIALNIDQICDPNAMQKLRNTPTPDEEADAWEFASSLLFHKGLLHSTNPGKDFCYAKESDIRKRIETILNSSPKNHKLVKCELEKRGFFK